MKQRAFFVWEKAMTGVWRPGVYWEYPPMKGIEGSPERTSPIELSDEHMREDGTPDIERLVILFFKPEPTE